LLINATHQMTDGLNKNASEQGKSKLFT